MNVYEYRGRALDEMTREELVRAVIELGRINHDLMGLPTDFMTEELKAKTSKLSE